MGLSDLSKAPGQALGDMLQLGNIESVIQWGRVTPFGLFLSLLLVAESSI